MYFERVILYQQVIMFQGINLFITNNSKIGSNLIILNYNFKTINEIICVGFGRMSIKLHCL